MSANVTAEISGRPPTAGESMSGRSGRRGLHAACHSRQRARRSDAVGGSGPHQLFWSACAASGRARGRRRPPAGTGGLRLLAGSAGPRPLRLEGADDPVRRGRAGEAIARPPTWCDAPEISLAIAFDPSELAGHTIFLLVRHGRLRPIVSRSWRLAIAPRWAHRGGHRVPSGQCSSPTRCVIRELVRPVDHMLVGAAVPASGRAGDLAREAPG
jgi:hypothetical protein